MMILGPRANAAYSSGHATDSPVRTATSHTANMGFGFSNMGSGFSMEFVRWLLPKLLITFIDLHLHEMPLPPMQFHSESMATADIRRAIAHRFAGQIGYRSEPGNCHALLGGLDESSAIMLHDLCHELCPF
jgi:hypothetical protein